MRCADPQRTVVVGQNGVYATLGQPISVRAIRSRALHHSLSIHVIESDAGAYP